MNSQENATAQRCLFRKLSKAHFTCFGKTGAQVLTDELPLEKSIPRIEVLNSVLSRKICFETAAIEKIVSPAAASSATVRPVFSRRLDKLQADWEAISCDDNVFLDTPFLKLLEENPPEDTDFGYVVFFKGIRPVGKAYFQTYNFNLRKSLQIEDKGIWAFLRSRLAGLFSYRMLVLGNLMLTGKHGYAFDEDRVPRNEWAGLLDKAIQLVENRLAASFKKVQFIVVKDFEKTEKLAAPFGKKYREFMVQPSMNLELPKEWITFEDYLSALQSKYRVRARRAFKKAKSIEKRVLSQEDIELHLPEIHRLYREVAKSASFTLVNLQSDYFQSLRSAFGKDFQMTGYFLRGRLVAFYTTIANHSTLEAHFLGFDQELNRKHQIYLNSLYDIIGTGIEKRMKNIHFARTALEIKSSVGAKPSEMLGYARHANSLLNKLMPYVFRVFNPMEEWVERHPFKESE